MKKHAIISAIATAGILLVGGAAFAQVNVSTGGPNSPVDVTVTNNTSSSCNVNNNLNVNNSNNQTTGSGNATGGSNTTAGGVTTGDANANSSNNTNVNVNNCTQATTSPVVTPTTTPVVTPKVESASTTVKALPDTGVSPLGTLVTVTLLTSAAAIVVKFGAKYMAHRA